MTSVRRRDYGSWSRLPTRPPLGVVHVEQGGAATALARIPAGAPRLPVGAGRTYGDSAVASEAWVCDVTGADALLEFDTAAGVLRAEAGMSLATALAVTASEGWTLPACPGTAAVTLGGMVAHDVHGKDHLAVGTFGRAVRALTLLRSDGSRSRCTAESEPELFRATLGGLGLTGVIEEIEVTLEPWRGPSVDVERLRCDDLDEALCHLREPDGPRYRLAWVDSFMGTTRVIVLRARTVDDLGEQPPAWPPPRDTSLAPWDVRRAMGRAARHTPPWAFTRATMRYVNRAYWRGGLRALPRRMVRRQSISTFLFPQDEAHATNHAYGARGVHSHHSWIPRAGDPGDEALRALMARAARPGEQSLVTVLKAFGDHPAPGVLSFTGEGTSVALGFRAEGPRTLRQLDDLDAIVLGAGGKLYLAKDARLSASTFRRSYPDWERLAQHVDPLHTSSLWQRIGAGA